MQLELLGLLPWSKPKHPDFPNGHPFWAQTLKEQPVWERWSQTSRIRPGPEKGQGLGQGNGMQRVCIAGGDKKEEKGLGSADLDGQHHIQRSTL